MKKQTISQATIAYQDEGQGHPVLFGHSFLWDSRMWQAQIDVLKKDYRCIAPDLWSHGQSDSLPHAEHSLQTLAEDYWQFTQALALPKCALVGLSVGGMWTVHFALSHPEAVSALILMDTYVGAEPPAAKAAYLGLLDELEDNQQMTTEFAAKVAPYFFAKDTDTEQPHLVSGFIQDLVASPTKHISGKVELGRVIFNRESLLEKLSTINIPTLVIVGEEDLPRPPHESIEMAALIPNSHLEIIPRAGHICAVERPQHVARVIQNFLAQTVTGTRMAEKENVE